MNEEVNILRRFVLAEALATVSAMGNLGPLVVALGGGEGVLADSEHKEIG